MLILLRLEIQIPSVHGQGLHLNLLNLKMEEEPTYTNVVALINSLHGQDQDNTFED
jgi:hypothetical protein